MIIKILLFCLAAYIAAGTAVVKAAIDQPEEEIGFPIWLEPSVWINGMVCSVVWNTFFAGDE